MCYYRINVLRHLTLENMDFLESFLDGTLNEAVFGIGDGRLAVFVNFVLDFALALVPHI